MSSKTHISVNLINNFKIIFILPLFAAILWGCKAPRENPLDINNASRELVTLMGYVHSAANGLPVQGAEVFWKLDNRYTTTDTSGLFIFTSIKPEDGFVIIKKDGFFDDSILVNWDERSNVIGEVSLNTVPFIEEIQFYSKNRNRFLSQEMTIILDATIGDDEGDLKSLRISSNELRFSEELNYQGNGRIFHEFQIWQLNVDQYQILTGIPFQIEAIDFVGREKLLTSVSIKRFIIDTISIVSPLGDSLLTTPTPTLRWNRYNGEFPFTYTVEVFSDDIPSQLLWEIEGLNSATDSIRVGIALPSFRSYTWFLWVVDAFGNRFSSDPATFRLEYQEN